MLIFGGTTDRCHPKSTNGMLEGSVCTHTESHWQTPNTFKDYFFQIIVPYKNSKIKRLKLPIDSWTLWTVDLHYSHKNSKAKNGDTNSYDIDLHALAAEHKVIIIYIPAGCTDIFQVCDTMVNFTFKSGVKRAFQFYLHQEYDKWVNEGKDALMWKPDLHVGVLKQFMINWINVGMAGLKTPNFALSIEEAFMRHACHAEMLSANAVAKSVATLAAEKANTTVSVTDYSDEIDDEQEVSDDESVADVSIDIGFDALNIEDRLNIE